MEPILITEVLKNTLDIIFQFKEILMLPICLMMFSWAIKLFMGLGGISHNSSNYYSDNARIKTNIYRVNLDKKYKYKEISDEWIINKLYNFTQKYNFFGKYFKV